MQIGRVAEWPLHEKRIYKSILWNTSYTDIISSQRDNHLCDLNLIINNALDKSQNHQIPDGKSDCITWPLRSVSVSVWPTIVKNPSWALGQTMCQNNISLISNKNLLYSSSYFKHQNQQSLVGKCRSRSTHASIQTHNAMYSVDISAHTGFRQIIPGTRDIIRLATTSRLDESGNL